MVSALRNRDGTERYQISYGTVLWDGSRVMG